MGEVSRADTDLRDVIERALLNTECPHGLGRFACAPCRSAAVVAALAEAGLVVVPAEDVTAAKLADVETARAKLPEDERRRLDAADAPMLRRQLAVVATELEWLRSEYADPAAAIERVRALLPPEQLDSDVTLAIHPAQVRAALPATEETRDE